MTLAAAVPGDKPRVLLVDDEERILRSLALLLRSQYHVQTTTDAHAAIDIVAQQAIDVIVSDQRMPIMRGADLLREVAARSPRTMRILLTGYSDLDAIVASVNEGEIFRYIAKPWNAAELRETVAQAAAIARQAATAPRPPEATDPAAVHTAPTSGTVAVAAPQDGAAVLVLDDDEAVCRAVRELLPGVAVHRAETLDAAADLLETLPIGVVVAELSLRGEPLAPVLKSLKAQRPEIVAIVMTPFRDTATLVELVNQAQVYRMLPKPLRSGPLGMNLESALKRHALLRGAPEVRARHVVEPMRGAEQATLGARLQAFIGRLRGRPTVS